jgi:hypothetical protein
MSERNSSITIGRDRSAMSYGTGGRATAILANLATRWFAIGAIIHNQRLTVSWRGWLRYR